MSAAAASTGEGVCPYNASHPVFVYLITDRRYTTSKHQQCLPPYVLMSENPLMDIRRQNREQGFSGADHTTKAGAGHLQVELVIGPFSADVAKEVRDKWRRLSRKLIQRVQTGVRLAREYGCRDVYCLDVEWSRSVLQQQQMNTKRVQTA